MKSVVQGALIATAVGLFITYVGYKAISDPKIGWGRDSGAITGDVGPAERTMSRIGGVFLILFGLFLLFFVAYAVGPRGPAKAD